MEGDPLSVSATITCLGRRKMLCPSCYCQNSSIALPLKMSSMIPQDELLLVLVGVHSLGLFSPAAKSVSDPI